MQIALTHKVSPKINECELTFKKRENIDYELAAWQHRNYCQTLRSAGLDVMELDVNSDYPDSVFIEDTAVVMDELAIIARPGVQNRCGETAGIEPELRKYRIIKKIKAPGTLEGGDVMMMNRDIFIGITSRTNLAGIEQFRKFVMPFGYRVHAVEVNHCLHLKSACTPLDEKTILANTRLISRVSFNGYKIIPVSKDEPAAANCLNLNQTIYLAANFPKTVDILRSHGYTVETIDISELRKAEGALTCSSIIFKKQADKL